MKSGIIVVNRYCKIPVMKKQAERLSCELEGLGVKVKIVDNGYLFSLTNEGKIQTELSGVDFCLFLDKDRYTSDAIESLGIRVFNPSKSIVLCDDKMLTYLSLVNGGIKMPKTIPSPLCYTDSEISLEELSEVERVLSYPIVVKLSYSSMGKGVFLAKDRFELHALCNKYKKDAKIFQEFIKSSEGKDVRMIVIGGKFLCGYERNSGGKDFRSNVALGGSGKKINPSKKFIEMAENTAKILNLDYMGCDLMYGENNEPILCEVNSNAFFEMAEEITGINVAKAYAEHILKIINK